VGETLWINWGQNGVQEGKAWADEVVFGTFTRDGEQKEHARKGPNQLPGLQGVGGQGRPSDAPGGENRQSERVLRSYLGEKKEDARRAGPMANVYLKWPLVDLGDWMPAHLHV